MKLRFYMMSSDGYTNALLCKQFVLSNAKAIMALKIYQQDLLDTSLWATESWVLEKNA